LPNSPKSRLTSKIAIKETNDTELPHGGKMGQSLFFALFAELPPTGTRHFSGDERAALYSNHLLAWMR
jgi:hypothetical protein